MHQTTKMDSHIKVKSLLNFMFVILILLCSQFVDYVHLDTEIPPTEEPGNWHMYHNAYRIVPCQMHRCEYNKNVQRTTCMLCMHTIKWKNKYFCLLLGKQWYRVQSPHTTQRGEMQTFEWFASTHLTTLLCACISDSTLNTTSSCRRRRTFVFESRIWWNIFAFRNERSPKKINWICYIFFILFFLFCRRSAIERFDGAVYLHKIHLASILQRVTVTWLRCSIQLHQFDRVMAQPTANILMYFEKWSFILFVSFLVDTNAIYNISIYKPLIASWGPLER